MELSRRDFLSLTALLAARPVQGATTPTYRTLGRTGLKVSEVAMGVMITSDPAQVRAALDAGVNYFDTARAYMGGRNEEILAEGLKGRRAEAVVATKCHNLGTKSGVVASAEQSLKALRTDVIDVFQLHGVGSRGHVLLPDHLEALEALRKAGKIRFAGVTTHSGMVEVLDAAVEAKVYDTVLTSLNFRSPPEVVAAVGRAAAAGVGVVAMKVMAGGYAAGAGGGINAFQAALRWVLKQSGVATAIPSMTTFEQVRENTAVMGTKATRLDDLRLRVYAGVTHGLYCRACGSCGGQCAERADVQTALRALMYAEGYGRPELAREALAGTRLPCAACGACSVRCRFGIPMGERMAAAVRLQEVLDA